MVGGCGGLGEDRHVEEIAALQDGIFWTVLQLSYGLLGASCSAGTILMNS